MPIIIKGINIKKREVFHFANFSVLPCWQSILTFNKQMLLCIFFENYYEHYSQKKQKWKAPFNRYILGPVLTLYSGSFPSHVLKALAYRLPYTEYSRLVLKYLSVLSQIVFKLFHLFSYFSFSPCCSTSSTLLCYNIHLLYNSKYSWARPMSIEAWLGDLVKLIRKITWIVL